MCNLSAAIEREGIAKGIAKGRTEGIAERAASDLKNLMKNLGLSLEQAMDALEIPNEERSNYLKLLKS